jgi:hypothetical protein
MSEDLTLTTVVRISEPTPKKLLKYVNIVLNELYNYLSNRGIFYNDPRTYLRSHNHTCVSKIIPITAFEKINDTEGFSQTKDILKKLFCRFESAFILSLSPGSDFRSYMYPRSRNIRIYIPLVIPYPIFSSGIWVEGRGVRYHVDGKLLTHPLSTKHSIFNYSSSENYILVIDI